MGETLDASETQFLESMSSARHLESAVDELGSGTQESLMSTAKRQIRQSKQQE